MDPDKNNYDLIVIGAGPAGLSAGFYAGLYGLNTLIIGETIGGQIKLAPEIIDYPGISSVKGEAWLADLLSQLQKQNVPLIKEKATKISPAVNNQLKKIFNIQTSSSIYSCSSLILAVGNQKRRPEYSGGELAFKSGIATSQGLIKVQNGLQTNLIGAFAAGNCLEFPQGIEQLSLAVAQGIQAAAQAYAYLTKQKPPLLWGKTKIAVQ